MGGDKTADIQFRSAAGHVNPAAHPIPVAASARKRSPNSGRRTQNSGALFRSGARDAADGGREITPPIFNSGRLQAK
jgi:hypothetical protein